MTYEKLADWWSKLPILDKYRYMESVGITHKPFLEVSIDEIKLMYGTTLDPITE